MAERRLFPRRTIVEGGAASLALALLGGINAAEAEPAPQELTFGVFADPQYGERQETIGRVYRDSPQKLAACIKAFCAAKPAFVIGLGDFVDGTSGDADIEMAHLKKIEDVFLRFPGPRFHVLGNHDLDAFTKEQFLKATGMPAPHYAFDAPPFRCIVLDACYRSDFAPYAAGNFRWTDSALPPEQQKWLAAELGKTDRKALVFVHQPLDDEGPHGVRNAPGVRRILEDSGKVVAVFQGHNHKGAYRKLRGIHYVTLCGMVEGPGLANNAFALVTVSPSGALRIKGFGNQPSSTRD